MFSRSLLDVGFPTGSLNSYSTFSDDGEIQNHTSSTSITEGESVISESYYQQLSVKKNSHTIFPRETRRFGEITIPDGYPVTFRYSENFNKPHLMIGEAHGWHLSFYPGGDKTDVDNFIREIDSSYDDFIQNNGVPSYQREPGEGGIHAPPWYQPYMSDEFPFSFFHVTLNKNRDHGRRHSVGFYFTGEGRMLGERVKYNVPEDKRINFTGYITPEMRERAWELSRLVATETQPKPNFETSWPKVVINEGVATISQEVELFPRPVEAYNKAFEPYLFKYSKTAINKTRGCNS